MPKIKFSALVSGMSGKANGSVFATNNGGSYFRTNASKIKPNTASNSVRKSLFAGVSQAWRSLTSDQQTAWNDAVASFVVQNAFGDNRTPTGYEVFTRLNNTRATNNLSLLVNPPSPRDLPAVGALELLFPDSFQYYPQFALSNFNRVNPVQLTTYQNSELYGTGPVMNDSFFSAMFAVNDIVQSTNATQSERILFDVACITDSLFEVSLVPTTGNNARIRIAGSNNASSWSATSTLEVIDLTSPFTIGIFMAAAGPDQVLLYVNGNQAALTVVQSGVFISPVGQDGLRLGVTNSQYNQRIILSDVRYYEDQPDPEEMRYITFGYIIGSETAMWPFDQITTGGNVNNVTSTSFSPFELQGGTNTYSLLAPFSSDRVPYMSLQVSSTGLAGCNLNIYATAPVSFGKTGQIPNYRLIASLPWTENTEFEISAAWKERFKSFSPNGYINFYVQVFDTTTGVIPATKVKPPKRSRFKAGSDWSTAVN